MLGVCTIYGGHGVTPEYKQGSSSWENTAGRFWATGFVSNALFSKTFWDVRVWTKQTHSPVDTLWEGHGVGNEWVRQIAAGDGRVPLNSLLDLDGPFIESLVLSGGRERPGLMEVTQWLSTCTVNCGHQSCWCRGTVDKERARRRRRESKIGRGGEGG